MASGHCTQTTTRLVVRILITLSLLATLIVATPRAAQAATATFSNSTRINTVYGGNAVPYPSTIAVSGMSGTISTLTISLHGMNHAAAQAFDVLLVGPDGAHLVVMGYAGVFEIENATFTFDDAAAAHLPSNNYLTSGTFRPTAYAPNVFRNPAPAHPLTYAAPTGSGTLTSVYRGLDPNGTWSLYVQDSYRWDDGYVSGGWSMTITTVTDSTPPVITPTVSGTVGSDGWYTDDVSVTWNVVEAESRVASSTGCDATSITTDTTGQTLTCTATSPGGTSTQSVTIKRDATAPALAPTVNPNPVEVDQPATANANASDAISGIASQSCDTPDTSTVGGQTVTCTTTDNAGNVATADASYTVSDPTAPVITSTVTGTLGLNDWYTSNMTVAWSVADAESDITATNGCGPTTITSDTAGTTLTCTATSAGGTSSDAVTIKRDATAPVVTYSGNLGIYALLDTIAINCTATDALSGVASDTCADVSGPGMAFGQGQHGFSAEATDNAGNLATGTTSFLVQPTYADLATLTQRYVRQATVERSALIMLEIARQADLRGQSFIADMALVSYRVQIQSGISRRYISAAEGAQLIALSRAL